MALVLSLGIGGAISWRAYRQSRPVGYRPDESSTDITSELARGLPPDAPRPRFTDVTRAAGLGEFRNFTGPRTGAMPEDIGPGLAWGDFDNDGDDDLFLVSAGGALNVPENQLQPCALFENLGHPLGALNAERLPSSPSSARSEPAGWRVDNCFAFGENLAPLPFESCLHGWLARTADLPSAAAPRVKELGVCSNAPGQGRSVSIGRRRGDETLTSSVGWTLRGPRQIVSLLTSSPTGCGLADRAALRSALRICPRRFPGFGMHRTEARAWQETGHSEPDQVKLEKLHEESTKNSDWVTLGGGGVRRRIARPGRAD